MDVSPLCFFMCPKRGIFVELAHLANQVGGSKMSNGMTRFPDYSIHVDGLMYQTLPITGLALSEKPNLVVGAIR